MPPEDKMSSSMDFMIRDDADTSSFYGDGSYLANNGAHGRYDRQRSGGHGTGGYHDRPPREAYNESYRDEGYDDGYYDDRHARGMHQSPHTPRTVDGSYANGDYPPPRRRDEYDDYDRSEAYDDYTADYSLPHHGTDGYNGDGASPNRFARRGSEEFSAADPDESLYGGADSRRRQRDPSVAGSVAPDGTPQITAGSVNYSGAISTMSASAITFDTHSSASVYTSKKSRSTKSRSTKSRSKSGSGEGSGYDNEDDGNTKSTAYHHQVIPISVSFPSKDGSPNSDANGGERSVVHEKMDEISTNLKRYIGHVGEASLAEAPPRRGGGGDDRSAYRSVASKPRPPLRKPDAAKSRHTMQGRGKSTRSVVSGTERSRASEFPPPPRKGRRERELHRGTGTRGLAVDDAHTDEGGRNLSRGRGTRQLNSAEGYDRRDERRSRSRSHGGSAHSGDASVKSHGTHSSWSVRHDIDEEGYCMHHPDVRLMKLKRDGNWRVVRKMCPDCIAEDCPNMIGREGSDRSGGSGSRGSDRSREKKQERMHHVSSSDIYHMSEHGGMSASKSMASSVAPSSLDAFQDLGMSFQTPEQMEEEEATNRLKRRLAARAYHFPGNTWCQDWMQYLSNTHTVLGLFFHHPLHPMGFQERLVILFGSIAIGLTISNFTYLYFIRNGIDVEEEVFTLNSRHTDMTGIPVVSITKLMITLWTLGSFIHTCFDLGLWHMKACTLCRYQGRIDERLVQWGRVAGLFIVMIAMGAGGYAVLLRASIEYKGEGSVADEVEESIRTNELYEIEFEDKRSFRFLLGYLVEFVLALFVYYPLAVTVLFSGVLGCGGRIPILGGRPREMKKETRYEMSKRRPKILKAANMEDENDNGETVDMYAASYRDDESRGRFDENEII